MKDEIIYIKKKDALAQGIPDITNCQTEHELAIEATKQALQQWPELLKYFHNTAKAVHNPPDIYHHGELHFKPIDFRVLRYGHGFRYVSKVPAGHKKLSHIYIHFVIDYSGIEGTHTDFIIRMEINCMRQLCHYVLNRHDLTKKYEQNSGHLKLHSEHDLHVIEAIGDIRIQNAIRLLERQNNEKRGK